MADVLVRVEDAVGGVKVVRLARPPMNALSDELLRQLGAALTGLRGDPGARALVLFGGDKVFCAGADVKDMHEALSAGRNPGHEVAASLRSVLDDLAAFPRATFAAITGYALGGGLEVALACDFRIAADTARLGLPEISLGIFPGGGGTQRLPRLVGPARAKRMILGGQLVDATTAERIGLVDEVVPAGEVLERALAAAGDFAAGAVAAQALAKRAVDEGLALPLPEGLDLEARLFEEVYTTEDAATGIASFVKEGPGKATFSGR